MESIKIGDKYELVEDLKNGRFECLRYGETWRDLVGDNLLLAMFYRIQELEEENKQLTKEKREHEDLIKIIDRARKLAFLQAEEEENRPRFRMDAEGNLTRIVE